MREALPAWRSQALRFIAFIDMESRISRMIEQLSEIEHCEMLKEKTRVLYEATESMYCPYFGEKVNFNSDGFHHFRYNSLGSERNKRVQIARYKLFPLASSVIRKAGTIQQHRKTMGVVGRKRRDGMHTTKIIEDWCFVALLPFKSREAIVRVVVRKIGDGNLNFLSIMPDRSPNYFADLDDIEVVDNQKHRV